MYVPAHARARARVCVCVCERSPLPKNFILGGLFKFVEMFKVFTVSCAQFNGTESAKNSTTFLKSP
jgi:hypothetical protein